MIIDPSGRGPTIRQLMLAGVAMFLVIGLITALLMMRYLGVFKKTVDVTALLTTTGDGLPANADVKYKGIFVGAVDSVDVAAKGETQRVSLKLKPEHADKIPKSVTARVVPSNVFAVTAVELLDNGPGPGLESGDTIQQDKSRETIALQDTLTTLQTILDKLDPMKIARVVGTLADALDGSGRAPGSTIERLDRWVTTVDNSIPDLGQDLSNFAAAAHGINQSQPQLLDSLGSLSVTARTLAEKRSQFAGLLTGAGGTFDTVNSLFARNPDSGKTITSGLNDTFTALTSDPAAIPGTVSALNSSIRQLDTVFHFGPQNQMVWNIDLSFSAYRPYTRQDCPRYGDLAGPSCATAPLEGDPGTLPPELQPRRVSAAGPAPTVQIPGLPQVQLPNVQIPGLALPGQAPAPQPAPAAATQAPAPAPTQAPAPAPANPFAGTPLDGLLPGLGQPAAADPGAVRPASYTGDGAVVAFTGGRPNAMQQIFLGPLFNGVSLRQIAAAAEQAGER